MKFHYIIQLLILLAPGVAQNVEFSVSDEIGQIINAVNGLPVVSHTNEGVNEGVVETQATNIYELLSKLESKVNDSFVKSKQDIESLHKRLQLTQTELDTKQRDLDAKQAALDQKQAELDMKQRELDTSQQETATLEGKIDETQPKTGEEKNKFGLFGRNKKEQGDDFQKKVKSITVELKAMERKYLASEKNLKEATEQLDKKKKQEDEFQKKVKSITVELEAMEKKYVASEKNLKEAKEQLDKKKKTRR